MSRFHAKISAMRGCNLRVDDRTIEGRCESRPNISLNETGRVHTFAHGA